MPCVLLFLPDQQDLFPHRASIGAKKITKFAHRAAPQGKEAMRDVCAMRKYHYFILLQS
jgi:hypothetical protein